MYTAKFNPNGAALSIDIQYKGAVTCSYVYALWESDSNAIVQQNQGNNLNPQDDSYELPTPNELNEGRFIQVFSTLKNGTTTSLTAIVHLKVFQGNKKILDVSEPVILKPMETGINEIFIQLKSN
jgi:hypothetical protein